jgi:hypothetical protein
MAPILSLKNVGPARRHIGARAKGTTLGLNDRGVSLGHEQSWGRAAGPTTRAVDEGDGDGFLVSIPKDFPRARNNRAGWKLPLFIIRHWTDHAKNIAIEMLSGHGPPNRRPFVE